MKLPTSCHLKEIRTVENGLQEPEILYQVSEFTLKAITEALQELWPSFWPKVWTRPLSLVLDNLPMSTSCRISEAIHERCSDAIKCPPDHVP